MIDKIVFDFGGVICDFAFQKYFSTVGCGQDDIGFIINKMFKGDEWEKGLDLGKGTFIQVIQALLERYPERKKVVDLVADTDVANFLPIRRNVLEYVRSLKSGGYKTYALTNLSRYVHDSFRKQYDGFDDLFDGITTSYEVGAVKPASQPNANEMLDTKIYKAFFKNNKINPSTALFIDDVEQNIIMGRILGMAGIQWTKEDTLETIKTKVAREIEKSKFSGIDNTN